MADNDSRAGRRYDTPAILDYVDRVHGRHDAALARAFSVPEGVPAIQVGPNEGRLLHVLARLIGATRVVEVGTLVGYSTIQLARGMAPGGRLWSVELEPRHAEIARGNLEAAGLADRVEVRVGPAVEVLATLGEHGPFDLVFVDADKVSYGQYATWAIANLRPGGLIVGDNTFLFGELADDTERARAMRSFHEQVAAACESVSVPTPDGMVIGIKR